MNSTLVSRPRKYPQNCNFSCFCDILQDKAQQIFLFSFPGRVPVIFHWISEGFCNSSFIEEIFNIKNWKKCSHGFFLQFNEPPILEIKFSESEMLFSLKYIWLALISENFMMIEKHVLKLLDSQSWPANVKFSIKMQFFMFLTPWKICFRINDKFEI